jgi:hypothetical protein
LPRLECVENGVGVLCEGDAADSKKEFNSDTSGVHGQHKIISDGKIVAMVAGKTRTHGS